MSDNIDNSTTRTPLCKCPSCGYEMDAATALSAPSGEKISPKPRDISVCIQCAEVLEFTEVMGVKLADLSTIMSLGEEGMEAVGNVQKLIREGKVKDDG